MTVYVQAGKEKRLAVWRNNMDLPVRGDFIRVELILPENKGSMICSGHVLRRIFDNVDNIVTIVLR